jgi:hypothetical protein
MSNAGPKSVLADAKNVRPLAAERERQAAKGMNEIAKTFGRGLTVSEEDELRRKDKDEDPKVEDWRARRMAELRSGACEDTSDDDSDDSEGWESKVRKRRRGAVRQVDAQGLLAAIERPGWALLFIYEPVSLAFPPPFHPACMSC